MIEMRQDEDGVFRPHRPEIPLPYGLPDDPQEPYVAIVAPNIDKISAGAFAPHTLAGRRTRRGLIAFAASIAGGLVVIGGVVAVQSVMSMLGAE
jgi:hypothetical protein